MARRDVLLRLLGDPDSGKNAIREVLREVEHFDGTEAEARLILRKQGIEEQIEKVRLRLANLSKQEATPAIKLKMARAVEQIDRLELKLDKLDHKDVEVKVDVKRSGLDRVAGIFASIDRSVDHSFRRIPFLGGLLSAPIKVARVALSGLSTAIEKVPELLGTVASGVSTAFQTVSETVKGLLSGTTSLSSVLGSAGSGLAGMAAQGAAAVLSIGVLVVVAGVLVIALNAILGAVIALGGALIALVASAAAAAAGLGALGIAFGAVFGAGLLVAIALIQRFAAVVEARKAREQELTKAVEDQKTAEDARKAALENSRRAEEQLAQATVEGRKAMAQAAIDERNAELGLEASRLGVRRSRLELAQARKDLKDLISGAGAAGPKLSSLLKQFSDVDFNPASARGALQQSGVTGKIDPLDLQDKILRVQEAQLGVKQAVEQTTEAQQHLSNAQKTQLDFARRGLQAYGPYRTALHQVAISQDNLAKAEDKASQAHVVYEQKLRKLSQTERGFLGDLDRFIGGLKRLAQAITAPIFGGLDKAMGSLEGLFKDTGITSALTAIGQAIGQFFSTLGRELTSADWRSAFQQFAQAGARMIGTGGSGFISMLRILREIALAALPLLEHALHSVSNWLGRIAGQPGAIHRVVGTLVSQFQQWSRFAGAVARLVINLFAAAAPAGQSLAGSLTHIVNRWADWIHDNPAKVRQFFHDAAQKTKEIVHWISSAVTWLKDHLPAAARTAAGAFREVAKIASGIYHSIKAVVDLLGAHPLKALHDITHPSVGGTLKTIGKLPVVSPLGFALHKLGLWETGGYTGDAPGIVHPREFVLREAITNALGVSRLNALNAGVPPELVFAGATPGPSDGGGSRPIHIDRIEVSSPGNDYPDGRHAAAQLSRELRRLGA